MYRDKPLDSIPPCRRLLIHQPPCPVSAQGSEITKSSSAALTTTDKEGDCCRDIMPLIWKHATFRTLELDLRKRRGFEHSLEAEKTRLTLKNIPEVLERPVDVVDDFRNALLVTLLAPLMSFLAPLESATEPRQVTLVELLSAKMIAKSFNSRKHLELDTRLRRHSLDETLRDPVKLGGRQVDFSLDTEERDFTDPVVFPA
jgi:hypothetical protein